MKTIGMVSALALAVSLAGQASAASDKQDFVTCDGRMQPGRQDDGMRGAASQGPYGMILADRADVVGACTRALMNPRLLPTQTLRRAHLLRARAAAHLRKDSVAEALADLDQAEAATTGLTGDRFYRRSMKVSLELLRALAYAKSGRIQDAVPLVRAAIDARPYSLAVQRVGADILQLARPIGRPSASPWTATIRLEPDARVKAMKAEVEVGNLQGILALRPGLTLVWPDKPLGPLAMAAQTPDAARLLTGVVVSLDVAYARAATGDAVGAARDVADVRARLVNALAKPAPVPGREKGASVELTSPLNEMLGQYVDKRARLIDARIALAGPRPADALPLLVNTSIPTDALGLEFLSALKARISVKDAAQLPDESAFAASIGKKRIAALSNDIPIALLAPETSRVVIDYEKARPNILGALAGAAFSMGTSLLGGIARTDGFRSTANADGTTKVEFIGNTPSEALVQEMTLLRAAEITRTAKKTAFAIVDRTDYARTLTTTRGGMEISRVPTGFKTELTIRFVDAATETGAFDATAVIDALGPFYYEERSTAARPSSAG